MSATITKSAGTFSTMATSERPVQHRDGVEQRFTQSSLAARANFTADLDMYQEVTQFIGLAAADYSVPPLAVLMRLRDIVNSLLNTEDVPSRRVFSQ